MGSNRSLLWAQFLRSGAIWALRQLLGVLAIVVSIVLLIAMTSVAEALGTRFGWLAVATAVGIAAWLVPWGIALYASTRLLRLRRDRSIGLGALLAAVYLIVIWAAGGLPLAPRLPDLLPTPPAAAAERPLIQSVGGPSDVLAPPPVASPTATPMRAPWPTPVPPNPTPAPLAATLPLWGQTTDGATLWSSADADASAYNTVPSGAYFRILGASDERFRVYYSGDRARRRPGEAWLDKSALAVADWPQFVQNRETTPILSEPNARASMVATVPRGSYLEVMRTGTGEWARVLYLGNGRDNGPYAGWASAAALVPSDVEPRRIGRFAATAAALSHPPEVWLKVPYVSQLDGSPWAAANCGPTTVAMLLEAHGIQATTADVRRQVMALQGTQNCTECGSFIESLAGAVDRYGLRSVDLSTPEDKLRRWSMDDVRAALRAGRPVLPQVMYRQLPGREDSPYWGDHYIVVTGILGDYFLYNDPIDDGPGYGRLISGEQLRRAMAASDFPMAAFATAVP